MNKLMTMFFAKYPAKLKSACALATATLLANAGASAWATQNIPTKLAFTADVVAPTAISYCGGSLWAYSIQTQKLMRLNKDSGAISLSVAQSAIGVQGSITALGCAAADLLIGAETGKNSAQLYRYPFGTGAGARAKPLTLPGKGLIRDLFCRSASNDCFAIRDSVFHSGNLQNWTAMDLPRSGEVPAGQDQLAENPFAGWQDRFIVGKGRYFRGQVLDSTLYLLDPLRAAVVQTALSSAKESPPARKWGKWGVWEGKLMWAKGLAPIGKDFIAISDTGLKLVFVFTRDGEYAGSFGADGGATRFKYPLDIASSDGKLYVADADAGKIYAYDITATRVQSEFKLPKKDEDLEGILRKNLFRDPSVLADRLRLRCLGCHDGLEVNSLKQFMGNGEHHPLYVEPSSKIDLPLEAGKMVTCSSCHDSHHATRGKKGATGAMLRKPMKALCLTCHQSKGNPAFNHPQSDPDQACAECHMPHGAKEYLLKQSMPGLCVSCHGDDIIPQGHPDMQDCASCHSLHDAQQKFKFATHSGPNPGSKVTCLACHHDKGALFGKNYHLGTESQQPHSWPQPEAVCLDCHNPHKKFKEMKQICQQCHDGITGTHPASIPIADTAVAKGVILKHDKVVCTTCHEPHGTTPPNPDGRSFFRDSTQILPFCASCHGEEAKQYYKEFHKRTK